MIACLYLPSKIADNFIANFAHSLGKFEDTQNVRNVNKFPFRLRVFNFIHKNTMNMRKYS